MSRAIKVLAKRYDCSEHWVEDCLIWHGRVLKGKRAHWCPEWDYLPIDDTCEMEVDCCTCKLEEQAA